MGYRIGISENGQVFLYLPLDGPLASVTVNFSPDQARGMAHVLKEQADLIEKLRTVNDKPQARSSATPEAKE